jgi:hypothetical protein
MTQPGIEPTDDYTRRPPRRPPPKTSSGDAVYGLGMIGALVWFWRRADAPGEHVLAVLKAFVWPAFLVHRAFEALDE